MPTGPQDFCQKPLDGPKSLLTASPHFHVTWSSLLGQHLPWRSHSHFWDTQTRSTFTEKAHGEAQLIVWPQQNLAEWMNKLAEVNGGYQAQCPLLFFLFFFFFKSFLLKVLQMSPVSSSLPLSSPSLPSPPTPFNKLKTLQTQIVWNSN